MLILVLMVNLRKTNYFLRSSFGTIRNHFSTLVQKIPLVSFVILFFKMSTGTKRKRDNHDSNGSNKRRKMSQSQKQTIKRPPRNMKIKCAPNIFMILPKPFRHGSPEF